MTKRRRFYCDLTTVVVCALFCASSANATGIPIGGFLPTVGIALTNEFNNDFETSAFPSSAPSGTLLGQGGIAHYDIALMDTGAALSLLTAQAHFDFKMDGPYPGNSDGFQGTEPITIGGATGQFVAMIDDPVGLYAGGLSGVTGTSPLTISHSVLEGQTNTSMATLPANSDLPNILGLPFVSQYSTYIRNDQPQFHQINGRTVRSPNIIFNAPNSGGQGIARHAFMTLDPGASFQQPPFWFYNIENFDIDHPEENPSIPTVIQGGMFLTANLSHGGTSINNSSFLFDTGADVTVLSQQIAYSQLHLDPAHPDFTVAVVGSGGTKLDVPGYFLESFTIQADDGTLNGNLTLSNVPIIVLNVTSPANPPNVLNGIIGTNLLAGRNSVIAPADPNGPSLYIGEPVTTSKNWASSASSATWSTGSSWSGGTTPGTTGIANVRHVSGGNQIADLTANANVWEVNVSGTASQTMTVVVENGVRLTTFSGVNVETGGVVQINNGTIDAQFVEIAGGTLRGAGLVTTGSGPIPGQVENRSGVIAPGNGIGTLTIEGRFANAASATLAIELGGLAAGSQHDQLVVDGGVALNGTLQVSLVGFTPFAGDTFTIISGDDVSGQFNNLLLPASFTWNVAYGATDVVLSVTGPGLIGDFNGDSKVDGADYVVWRKIDGSALRYQNWRSHYGTGPGSGTENNLTANVPEPASMLLIAIPACVLAVRRRGRLR